MSDLPKNLGAIEQMARYDSLPRDVRDLLKGDDAEQIEERALKLARSGHSGRYPFPWDYREAAQMVQAAKSK